MGVLAGALIAPWLDGRRARRTARANAEIARVLLNQRARNLAEARTQPAGKGTFGSEVFYLGTDLDRFLNAIAATELSDVPPAVRKIVDAATALTIAERTDSDAVADLEKASRGRLVFPKRWERLRGWFRRRWPGATSAPPPAR